MWECSLRVVEEQRIDIVSPNRNLDRRYRIRQRIPFLVNLIYISLQRFDTGLRRHPTYTRVSTEQFLQRRQLLHEY